MFLLDRWEPRRWWFCLVTMLRGCLVAMAAVLFAVGRSEQPPDFVSYMLDLSRCRVKPAYNIASEEPLLLCDCKFPADLVNFQAPVEAHVRSEHIMSTLCASLVSRAALVSAMDQV